MQDSEILEFFTVPRTVKEYQELVKCSKPTAYSRVRYLLEKGLIEELPAIIGNAARYSLSRGFINSVVPEDTLEKKAPIHQLRKVHERIETSRANPPENALYLNRAMANREIIYGLVEDFFNPSHVSTNKLADNLREIRGVNTRFEELFGDMIDLPETLLRNKRRAIASPEYLEYDEYLDNQEQIRTNKEERERVERETKRDRRLIADTYEEILYSDEPSSAKLIKLRLMLEILVSDNSKSTVQGLINIIERDMELEESYEEVEATRNSAKKEK